MSLGYTRGFGSTAATIDLPLNKNRFSSPEQVHEFRKKVLEKVIPSNLPKETLDEILDAVMFNEKINKDGKIRDDVMDWPVFVAISSSKKKA